MLHSIEEAFMIGPLIRRGRLIIRRHRVDEQVRQFTLMMMIIISSSAYHEIIIVSVLVIFCGVMPRLNVKLIAHHLLANITIIMKGKKPCCSYKQ
jgi:hypothetical protein